VKTEMQREYEQLCRIDENPGVQGLAQLGRNAINRVSRLESQLASADARIAELERNIERLDAQWREELRIYREADDARIAELEAEVSGLRVDAERWRKLRGMHWSKEDDFTVTRGRSVKLGFLAYSGEQLDAAIDAARANGGGE